MNLRNILLRGDPQNRLTRDGFGYGKVA